MRYRHYTQSQQGTVNNWLERVSDEPPAGSFNNCERQILALGSGCILGELSCDCSYV